MTPRIASLFAPLVASAALLGSSACASARPSARGPASERPLSNAEMAAIVRARTDSARMKFTEADVQFMTGMIAHHAQAIVMSRLAPSNGASPSIRTLAARIINAQQDEIALMQTWLRDRRQPVPEVTAEGHAGMSHGGMHHDAHMPGMLTSEQMAELAKSHGVDFDRLFLTFMIAHHKGAVTMVNTLLAQDGAGQDDSVFKLAADVSADQTTEIARMERMLLQLHLGGRSP
jgi:uncharacterized protein (DUF305 family)